MHMQSSTKVKQQWESAADWVPQFICLLDREGRVIRANRAAEGWKLKIDIEGAAGLRVHDVLHRDCDDSRCYLRRFWERAAVALARGRSADCDAWDPLLKRHFLIRARRPMLNQSQKRSLTEVFAVITVDDVTEFRALEKQSENLAPAAKQRIEREQGKQTRPAQNHSRIAEALDHAPGCSARERDTIEPASAEETSRALQKALRQRAAEHLTMQESERRRIAGELHDGLGQSLSLLKFGIRESLGQMGAGVPRKAVESVRQLIPIIEGTLNELHRISMDLRPSTLDDLGILPTLSWFVREFEAANQKTRIEKDVSVSENDVPAALRITIYRILQEAVANAVKHSGGGRIKISLHKGEDVLAFTVEDDGKGFDPAALAPRGDAAKGYGLQSMRDRAELSGGSYALTSAAGNGTKVCVWWPASQETGSYRDQARCAMCGRPSGVTVDGVEVPACYCTAAPDGAQLESNTSSASRRPVRR